MENEKIDCYPWAAPTEEQKRMFDALCYEDQLEMRCFAIELGRNGGVSNRFLNEIIENARERLKQ